MAWNFTADSEIQTELSTNLNTYADNYDAKVEAMYGKISEMGSYWVGDDYDLFNTGCEGYRGALKDLSNSIRLYSVHFSHVSEGTVTLANTLVQLIQEMTEFCGAGPGGAGGNGGTGNGGSNGGTGNGGSNGGTGNGGSNGGTGNGGSNGGTGNGGSNGGTGNGGSNGGTGNGGRNGGTGNGGSNGGTGNGGSNGGTGNGGSNGGTGNGGRNGGTGNGGSNGGGGGWSSYQDAAADGYSNIMTESEFARAKSSGGGRADGYDTYQDYLDAMYKQYQGSPRPNPSPSGNGGSNGGGGDWSSYQDAAADGYSNIMTESEFARAKSSGGGRADGYDTYQDYLDAMYNQYQGSPRPNPSPSGNGGSNGGGGDWSSYQDAAADGYSNIMTESEFARAKSSGGGRADGYDTYQDYLDAMYKKYQGSPRPNPSPSGSGSGSGSGGCGSPGTSTQSAPSVSATRGDTVKVDDKAYVYWGTTSDGVNIYKDPSNNYMYYDNGDGNMVATNSLFDGFVINGMNVNNEVVYPVDVSNSVNYIDGNDAPFEPVASGGDSAYSTYTHNSSNYDFAANSTSITSSDNSAKFTQAVRNHENICVDANIKVKADPWGIWNTATLSDGRSKTYLVYDKGTGMYYVADANGSYSTNSTGYNPEDLINDAGGVYFY